MLSALVALARSGLELFAANASRSWPDFALLSGWFMTSLRSGF